jgi:tocopherol cyclase
MLNFIQTTMNPAVYHGPRNDQHPRLPFFEGWYFKLVDAQESARLAVIPGVFYARDPQECHAFIQVLDGVSGQVSYHQYPIGEFQAAKAGFDIRIGTNHFNQSGMTLDIADSQRTLRGEIHFHDPAPIPWPVTPFSPGIMGWYAWVPFMECYHGVISFDHGLDGDLRMGDQQCDFTGGRGYIEKDWGRSFPSAWIWTQTNHFKHAHTCLTASIAIIPWLGNAFPGFIVGLWHNGQLYRFATYTGAHTRVLDIGTDRVRWQIANRRYTLEITAYRAQGGLLKAPTPSGMNRRIAETLDARVSVRLSQRSSRGNLILFEGEGRNAGLEAVGDLTRLRQMLFRVK